MMKRIIFCATVLLTAASVSLARVKEEPLKIRKLVLEKRQSHSFQGRDSTVTIVIDTLIMNDRSSLRFFNKKDVNLVIRYAVIGKDCVIGGDDGKNNGTNIILSANFVQLKKLSIDVSGLDAKMSNRNFDNGNGGKVVLNYLTGGVKPQLSDSRSEGYIEISNHAGGYRTNAQSDLYTVYSRLQSGVPGRPLSQLPNGRVYSGGIGRDGKSDVIEVKELLSSPASGTAGSKDF